MDDYFGFWTQNYGYNVPTHIQDVTHYAAPYGDGYGAGFGNGVGNGWANEKSNLTYSLFKGDGYSSSGAHRGLRYR
jgi:hypothetical protein